MIGGTMAGVVFRHKVHVGFVAASNAGGVGSLVAVPGWHPHSIKMG